VKIYIFKPLLFAPCRDNNRGGGGVRGGEGLCTDFEKDLLKSPGQGFQYFRLTSHQPYLHLKKKHRRSTVISAFVILESQSNFTKYSSVYVEPFSNPLSLGHLTLWRDCIAKSTFFSQHFLSDKRVCRLLPPLLSLLFTQPALKNNWPFKWP
jgi:hypothetical protein